MDCEQDQVCRGVVEVGEGHQGEHFDFEWLMHVGHNQWRGHEHGLRGDEGHAKAREALKDFVSYWSEEGRRERFQAFGPVLDALRRLERGVNGRRGEEGFGSWSRALETCLGALTTRFALHRLHALIIHAVDAPR
jgi:hypothetical protein